MSQELYTLRDVHLCCCCDQYIVTTDGAPDDYRRFIIPMEAWNYFSELIDFQARRRIITLAEKQGRNPYTWEEIV